MLRWLCAFADRAIDNGLAAVPLRTLVEAACSIAAKLSIGTAAARAASNP